jgi:hypothetical protein
MPLVVIAIAVSITVLLNLGLDSSVVLSSYADCGTMVAVGREGCAGKAATGGNRPAQDRARGTGTDRAGLGFHLVERIVSKGIVACHIAWDSAPVTTPADQALAAAGAGNTAQALGEAVDFLRDELAAGPRAVREIKASAVGVATTIKRPFWQQA